MEETHNLCNIDTVHMEEMYYEDEMVRLASEISLMDDLDFEWDPCNHEEARYKISYFEEIVDEHLAMTENFFDNCGVSGDPISEARIKDIFSVTESNLNEIDCREKLVQNPSVMSISSLRGSNSTENMDKFSQYRENYDNSHLSRLTFASKKERSVGDTITTIRAKLRWYQKKIVQQIESSNEVLGIEYCYLLFYKLKIYLFL